MRGQSQDLSIRLADGLAEQRFVVLLWGTYSRKNHIDSGTAGDLTRSQTTHAVREHRTPLGCVARAGVFVAGTHPAYIASFNNLHHNSVTLIRLNSENR